MCCAHACPCRSVGVCVGHALGEKSIGIRRSQEHAELARGEEKTSKCGIGMRAAMWGKKTLRRSRADPKEQVLNELLPCLEHDAHEIVAETLSPYCANIRMPSSNCKMKISSPWRGAQDVCSGIRCNDSGQFPSWPPAFSGTTSRVILSMPRVYAMSCVFAFVLL